MKGLTIYQEKGEQTYEFCCPECGHLLSEGDLKYLQEYPNSSAEWFEELLINHKCSK